MPHTTRNKKQRINTEVRHIKPASLPPWYNSDSDSDDSAARNPESFDYWKDFQLPSYLEDKYPYGYNFFSDVLQGKSSFKSLECSEHLKLKICSEVCMIFQELDISDTHVHTKGKSSIVMDQMERSLPGLSMLLLRADHALQCRNRKIDDNRKVPASKVREKRTLDVGSRVFWENVSFDEKIKKKHSEGLAFLQRLLRKQASINHFYGDRMELVTVCKDLIHLHNILKIGDKLNCQGKLSTLTGKVIEYIPGMNNLLREADSAIENPKRVADIDASLNEDLAIENPNRLTNNEDSTNTKQNEGMNTNTLANTSDNDSTESSKNAKLDMPEQDIARVIKNKQVHDDMDSVVNMEGGNNLDLSVSDLWCRPNAKSEIHRAINILCGRYAQRSKDNKGFNSVKDLMFRYMSDYGLCVLTANKSVMTKDSLANKEEASSKLPIAAAAIVDMVHEVESVDGRTKSHFALVVLLHTSINKYLFKLLQHVMRTKSQEVTHIYFSTLDHRKGPLLVYKPPVRCKVDEHRSFLKTLGCIDTTNAMVVNNYLYEAKTSNGTSKLSDFHKIVGNRINNVRNNLHKLARKEEGWFDLGRTETHLVCTYYKYFNPHVIDSSDCGYYVDKTGERRRFVIPHNTQFGRSNVNIYGLDLGFPADYNAVFEDMDERDESDDDGPQHTTISHRRAGMSGSTDCCIWLSVLTMLNKYDPTTSKEMRDMMAADTNKFRHMWILRSRSKTEDTFDQVMRKSFGYYLKRRDESYLFKEGTKGMFICLLQEEDGNTLHAVTVEKSKQLLMYDFEDEYQFLTTRRLDNFHCVTNCKSCVGLQIVAEIIPPKKKSLLFPFNYSV